MHVRLELDTPAETFAISITSSRATPTPKAAPVGLSKQIFLDLGYRVK